MFWTRTFRNLTFWTWTFRTRTFRTWTFRTRTFRTLTFLTWTITPQPFRPGRFAPGHVCKHFWKTHFSTLLFLNPWMYSVIYGFLLDTGLKLLPESQGHGLRIFMLQVYHIFANPLMDLVHIWHDDRYWSKHFRSTKANWSCINRWYVHGVATCEWDGHDVMWTGCGHENEWSCVKGVMCERSGSHVKRMITCKPGCGYVNWLVMFEWDHLWTVCGRVNEVVTCERVKSNSGGHVWMGWSRMNEVCSCERGRHVNWVRCDTFFFFFFFELLIIHIENAIKGNIFVCRHAF